MMKSPMVTWGVSQVLHEDCSPKHSSTFPIGLRGESSSHCGGKTFLQTLPHPGFSHCVQLKTPMTT